MDRFRRNTEDTNSKHSYALFPTPNRLANIRGYWQYQHHTVSSQNDAAKAKYLLS